MQIRLLGSLEVVDDAGSAIAVSGRRLQALLVVLALRCGEVVVADRLVDDLWGDERASLNALQRQISTLRRALGTSGVVEWRGSGYVLVLDRAAIDVDRFETLAAAGRAALSEGDPARASVLLSDALALWRGDALADFAYEEFAQSEIARLSEARLAAIEMRVDADLALGRGGSLVAELELLVVEHPLREHLRAQHMIALARSGRQAEALRSYQGARAVLGEELGLEPSQELRTLEASILRQEGWVVRNVERATPDIRTNLRTLLTSFIGRTDELAALRGLLHTQRLVTLVGPGGSGKTRLALESGREWRPDGDGEVWLVELADVSDPAGVVGAILRVLNIPQGDDSEADVYRLTEYLCGRRVLLLLDNCEHVIVCAASVAQLLLELCPALTILSTSREALGITGEVLWPVPPLPLDDAVALFVERGQSAAPMSRVSEDSEDTRSMLQDICARLDGLPLAIELAAARLHSMPMNELVAGLDDRFRLLNRGARTARPRQQTLRAVVDWSYGLLFDDERSVLDRLSVFAGGCTFEAARVVCADDDITPEDVTDLLTRLADKSLITIGEEEASGCTRCRMLQTLVDYGRERLASSGEASYVYAAHARYFKDLALDSTAALRGERQRMWLRSVGTEVENFRAALHAAVASDDADTACAIAGSLGWYWWFTGRAGEGARWVRLAAQCGGQAQQGARARLLAWTAFFRAPGFVAWGDADDLLPARGPDHGRPPVDDELDALGARALELFRGQDELEELPAIENALAVAYSTVGDQVRVRELLFDAERALTLLDGEARNPALQAYVRARRAFAEDRFADAEAAFRTSTELLTAADAEVYRSFAQRYIGRLAALRGDYGTSIEAIEAALTDARDLGLSAFANVLTTDLGEVLARGGNFMRARAIFEQLLAAARDVRSVPAIGEALTALAIVEWRAGNHEEAGHLAAEALEVLLGVGNVDAIAQCLAVLGFVAERRGDSTEARARHLQGLELARGVNEPRRVALALEGLAGVALLERDARDAVRLLGAADTLRQSPGRASGWAFARAGRGDVLQLIARAKRAVGPDVVTRAFADGAASPDTVLAGVVGPASPG